MDRRTVSIAIAAVVIAVVAIFGYVAVEIHMSGPPRSAEDAQRLSDMSSLKDALNKYFNENQSYPTTPPADQCSGKNNVVDLSSALVPKYISSIPKDPDPRACGYNYFYTATPDGKSYALLVNLQDIDPATYSDRWCIGASSGTVAAIAHDGAGKLYLPCPP